MKPMNSPSLLLLPARATAPPSAEPTAVAPHGVGESVHAVVALRPLLRAVVAKTLGRPLGDPFVDETLQEAMTEVLAALPSRRGAEDDNRALRSFVVAIAANCARNAIRGFQRRRAESPIDEPTSDPAIGALASAGLGEALEARSDLRAIQERIAQLPEGQRRAFIGFFLEEKSYETLAAEFAVPIGTVATWIFRAKSAVASVAPKDHR